MSQTKNKPARKNKKPQTRRAPEPKTAENGEVLTLAEAAAYLRVSEAEVIRLVQRQDLPGRLLGAKWNEWRFLKSALQDWLRNAPPRGSKEAQLAVAGAWKDDPLLEEELREIYRQRGRPMIEEKS